MIRSIWRSTARVSGPAGWLLAAVFAQPGAAQQPAAGGTNFFSNPDMTRAIAADVLWEGVDGKGNLRVPTYSRIAASASGKVTGISMPASPAIGDVTGDDIPDLVVGDGQGYIWVFRNSGTKEAPKFTQGEILPVWLFNEERWGGYQIHAGWERENPRYVPRVHLTDWDGNREPELVVGTFYGEIFHVRLSVNGGRVSVPNGKPTETEISVRQQGEFWGNFFTPCVYDWNNDGQRDLIVGEGTYACNAVYLLVNTGNNTTPRFKPEERKVLVWGDGREQLAPVVVDWDNDGNPDVLVADYKGEFWVHLNKKGDKELKEPLSGEGLVVQIGSSRSFGQISRPALGDMNGDGLFDMVVGKSDGTLHLAINKGKAGAPKFDKLEAIKGVDVYPAGKRPVYWTDNYMRSGAPYHVVEQINDPTNTAGPGRSGAECIKLSYVEPAQTVASGKFPEVGAKIKDFRNMMRYEPRLNMNIGRRYELSFWIRRSGFPSCEWYVWGEEWEKGKTRRGEELQWYGRKRLSVHQIRKEVPTGAWRQIRETITVPGKVKDSEISHIFWILTDGKGEVCLDDVSLRPL